MLKQSNYRKLISQMKGLFCLSVQDLCWRIFVSLIPPVSNKYKKVFSDLLGPGISIISLTLLLNYGNLKRENVIFLSPMQTVSLYVLLMPVVTYCLNKLGRSTLTFLQIFSLIGYGLYGHILTLLVSLLYHLEDSNTFFFICLIAFAGVSTFRVVLLQFEYMPLPGARLVVCSSFSTLHILFLVFIHFVYMHPKFSYNHK
ncbi:hypothetical protein RN001_012714 [Aquatica leii]|uniref:Protein YIPF3 n=1 Tax=Aquatica leii TaxID=1421715 RepID=A0AAN7PUQ3_9COLE|nr:hypothetical protein RN001_012714 [Aquatica leii]